MSAKDILVKPISAKEANDLIKRVHYSGKVVNNSQVHMGVFYGGRLEGALQFGPSLDKAKIQGLVKDTNWNAFIELNRMAFSEALPRNSESRAIAIAMRLLKKHAPHIQWVISFADGTQCGDGTIYRASGFYLTQIKKNSGLRRNPETGEVMQNMTAFSKNIEAEFRTWPLVPGFQFRYIYFLDPKAKDRLTVPIVPFSEIAKQGATMYKGVSGGSISSNASDFRSEEGGANPTPLLQPSASNLLDTKPL